MSQDGVPVTGIYETDEGARYEVVLDSVFKRECKAAARRAGFKSLSTWTVQAMKNELERQQRREAMDKRKKR